MPCSCKYAIPFIGFLWNLKHSKRTVLVKIITYSFKCYFSRLEYIAYYKAKNQNIVKTNFHEHAHTHTHTQQNSLKRRDFKDDFKNVSMFDDLTLQGRPFQTTLRNNPVRPLASSQSIIVHVPVCVHVPACVCVCVSVKVLRTASMDKTLYKYFTYYYYYYSMLCYFDWLGVKHHVTYLLRILSKPLFKPNSTHRSRPVSMISFCCFSTSNCSGESAGGAAVCEALLLELRELTLP